MISQYDCRTGTRLVIAGLIQLNPAINRIMEESRVVTARTKGDCFAKTNPDKHVAQPINSIDS